MHQLIEAYENIIEPQNFIKNFKTIEDFNKWLDQGTVEDLEATLKAFEEAELYEHCILILKKIKNQ